MHAERTLVVSRPIDEVFEFLADGTRRMLWRPGIREVSLMTNATQLGAVYRQVVAGPGGRDVDCDYLITGWEPPTRLEFAVVAGPVRPTGSIELAEREANHTQITMRLDGAPQGLRRLLAPMWARGMAGELGYLDRLKSVVEAERSAV
jgi:uncharacterized protein YndB with AHSA1/START domain